MNRMMIGGVSLLAFTLVACNQQDETSAVTGTVVATGYVSGNHLYDTACGRCHETGVGPMLRGRQLPPELITQIVRNGMAAMPAFAASAISDEDLAEVARMIAESQAPQTQEQPNGN